MIEMLEGTFVCYVT